ncbi:hypothetical protein RND81_14G036800 [Saponaria officinalis]|uniref:Transposase n=1 Tax=Saponaria officinalis TaxID=3572 RepID=A0AAW1GIZ5_SAPOF
MYDVVHIDEKHFYMTRTTTKYYLLPNEPKPHRTCQSKRFITKIMFMAAVARPRYNEDGDVLFDGKIGIFPFIYEEEAKRSSKNREKGTMVTKLIESINKEVVKQCLLEKVIPTIKAKWPLDASGKIWIQQDNAKPHISPKDLDFLEVAKSDGFDMELICQPPNSPDLNILDLGFFRSIQSLQHKKSSKSILDLVDAVGRAYDEIDNEKLKFVWVSLHACMNEILRVGGSNSYSIPHVGKKRLDRNQLLENFVKPDMVCLERSLHALENMNDTEQPTAPATTAQLAAV